MTTCVASRRGVATSPEGDTHFETSTPHTLEPLLFLLFSPECALLQLSQGLFDLFARIHDEGPVARDGFVQRFAGYQEKTRRTFRRGHFDPIPLAQHDQLRRGNHCLVLPAEARPASAPVSKCRVPARDGVYERSVRRERYVEISWFH